MSASELTAAQKSVASINKLSEYDQTAFAFAESAVRQNLEGFINAGRALAIIRENKWYKSLGFNTFEAYVVERFQIKRDYAYKLMQSAEIVGNIIASQISENVSNCIQNADGNDGSATESIALILPSSESVARPLGILPASEQAPVWNGVVEKAKEENAPVTASRVQDGVDAHQGKTKPQTSIHHPAPTVATPAAKPAATAKTTPAPQANASQEKADTPAGQILRFTARAEMTLTNAYGTEVTTAYEIREEKDGKFHLWRDIKETASGRSLGGGPINVYSSYALAARAAQTDANAAQGIEPGDDE